MQLPGDMQLSAIGDFRSSLPMNPTSSIDLNTDGYTIDLPAGVRASAAAAISISTRSTRSARAAA